MYSEFEIPVFGHPWSGSCLTAEDELYNNTFPPSPQLSSRTWGLSTHTPANYFDLDDLFEPQASPMMSYPNIDSILDNSSPPYETAKTAQIVGLEAILADGTPGSPFSATSSISGHTFSSVSPLTISPQLLQSPQLALGGEAEASETDTEEEEEEEEVAAKAVNQVDKASLYAPSFDTPPGPNALRLDIGSTSQSRSPSLSSLASSSLTPPVPEASRAKKQRETRDSTTSSAKSSRYEPYSKASASSRRQKSDPKSRATSPPLVQSSPLSTTETWLRADGRRRRGVAAAATEKIKACFNADDEYWNSGESADEDYSPQEIHSVLCVQGGRAQGGRAPALQGRFSCDKCGQRFTRKTDMERHSKSKHGDAEGPWCDACKKHLSRDDALKRHGTSDKHLENVAARLQRAKATQAMAEAVRKTTVKPGRRSRVQHTGPRKQVVGKLRKS